VLTLKLTKLPLATQGIYTINGVEGRMPDRALFLHPDAASSFASFAASVVCSDIFRTAEASLAAVKANRGAQPPGFSAHNFGLAIDLDVKASMEKMRIVKGAKATLDDCMEMHGWFCHRRDHAMGPESWHYTFLGAGAVVSPKVQTLVNYTEARIVSLYGDYLKPDDTECQRLLQKLRLYNGGIDGAIGSQSKAAINVFQRGWRLTIGLLDAKTRRTLALVAADRAIVP
jgi:hypothetical protein